MHSAGALEAQPAHSRAQPHRTDKTISKACGTGPHGADALRHADDRQQQLAVQRVREPRLLHLQPSGGKPPRRTLAQAEPAIPLIPLRPSLQSRSSHYEYRRLPHSQPCLPTLVGPGVGGIGNYRRAIESRLAGTSRMEALRNKESVSHATWRVTISLMQLMQSCVQCATSQLAQSAEWTRSRRS